MDTIAAIATPTGHGGIGIVRLSGPRAIPILNSVFRTGPSGFRVDRTSEARKASHRMYHGHVIHPKNGQVVDEVLAVAMHAPHSYTREDVAEIQCHGGPAMVERILAVVIGQGARPAEPGEFTRRAFLNGRIDLSQAEAVIDLINAQNQSALELAARQLCGGLKAPIEQLIARTADILAELEARIEFPEDAVGETDTWYLANRLNLEIVAELQYLIDGYQKARILSHGLQVVIIGRPNVGKSSLMNRLVRQEKAIVTPIAGTTRDLVEESVWWDGMLVRFSDTAGLHESSNPIERVGIRKAYERLEEADMALVMVAADDPFTEADARILERIQNDKCLLVINKMDLVFSEERLAPPPAFDRLPVARVSALEGTGIGHLKAMICARGSDSVDKLPADAIVSNMRQKRCLEHAAERILHAVEGLEAGGFEDMAAMDLHDAIGEMRKISGRNIDNEVLEAVFNKFCIGK